MIEKIQKELNLEKRKQTKIAVLSSFTIQPISEILKETCYKNNIEAEIFVAPYGQYAQQILDSGSELYRFGPEIIFIAVDSEDIVITEKSLEDYASLIMKLKESTSSKIVVNSLLLPVYSSKGILENKDEHSNTEIIKKFNELLEKESRRSNQLFVFDFNKFCMRTGYSKLRDPRFVYLAHMNISLESLEKLSYEYLSYIIPLVSLTKKCIVVDLDNTLWGGIVGEAGISGIKLGPDKEGKPFVDFQKKLLELFNRGVILAVNSKNNLEDAMEVIKNHEYMVLREDNFACIMANWDDKVTNMKKIAERLNIGMDSFVFIDDSPSEREFVRKLVPEIKVLEMPEDPAYYSDTLDKVQDFNIFSITKEDLDRGKTYSLEKKREELRSSVGDIKEFIKQLNIKYKIDYNKKDEAPRIAQLTQKTNQFNLTTKRYTEEDILNFMSLKEYLVCSLKVEDRFGDYGLTGAAIIDKKEIGRWKIDSLLLSCRVLGKEVEFSFMKEIISMARKENVKEITASYIETKKNAPAKEYLKNAGFTLVEENSEKTDYMMKI